MSNDKNFLSLAGDGLGNIYRDGVLLFSADQPGMREIRLGDLVPDFPGSTADTLKLSGCTRLRVLVGKVLGGYEDCIDINHCTDIEVEIAEAVPTGAYIATIKGGSKNISLTVWNQLGHGQETDYDLGNWSDQSHERTTGVELTVYPRGKDVARCRILHAHEPKLNGLTKWEVSRTWKGCFHWFMDKLKRLNWA